METTTNQWLLWVVALPLAGAIINGFFGRTADRRLIGGLGVGTVVGSLICALSGFVQLYRMRIDGAPHPAVVYDLYEWFAVALPGGERFAPIEVRFVMDSLSGVMTLVVTGIGLFIHVFSLGYMDTEDDAGFARFFSYLNLFMASMLILVLASNIPMMFVGWEGVGLCSYLLIGYWYENPSYAAAGRKAFVANRVGDFGALMGMFLLVMATGSFEFSVINGAAPQLVAPLDIAGVEIGGMTIATAATLFLFLGCTGKSAQIPLYIWLPDAMAGPTPVSALIHAATMVTAGVYLCCRLSPVFMQSETTMAVIALIGTATALLAASIAVVQREMKKILAYSTVSQLGFMFAAVGTGAFAAGFFHVFTHAFFKGCLFLGAGAVMHAVGAHGDADIFKLGGLAKELKWERWSFLASCAAIAGVPLTSGFFSKDEILLGASEMALGGGAFGEGGFGASWVGWTVLVGLFVAAIMTAFYMFRLYFLTFTGEYRSAGGEGHGHDDHHAYAAHPHHNPFSIRLPLLVLGAGSLIAGYVGIPHVLPYLHTEVPHDLLWWGPWMKASVAAPAAEAAEHGFGAVDLASTAGLVAMAVGIGAAWKLYYNANEDRVFNPAEPGAFFRLVYDKWRVDELYGVVILGPIRALAQLVGHLDQLVVDGSLTKLPSALVKLGSYGLTRLQTGKVQAYGLAMVAGFTFVVTWTTRPHISVETEVEPGGVRFEAEPGLGYSYHWTIGEGAAQQQYDTPTIEHRFSPAQYEGFSLLVNTRGGTFLPGERELPLSEHVRILRPSDLGGSGPGAEIEGEAAVVVRDDKVFLRPNGVTVGNLLSRSPVAQDAPDEIELPVGRPLRLGNAIVRVAPRVSATLEVHNVFGNAARETFEVTLGKGGRIIGAPPVHAALELPGVQR